MTDENRLGQQCGGSGIGFADEGKRLWLMEAVLNGLPQSLRVVDRDLNLIYANRAARARGEECVAESDGKCYSTMGRNEPCESCPVTELGPPAQHPYTLMTQAFAQEQPADGASSCSVLSALAAPSEGVCDMRAYGRCAGNPSSVTGQLSQGSFRPMVE